MLRNRLFGSCLTRAILFGCGMFYVMYYYEDKPFMSHNIGRRLQSYPTNDTASEYATAEAPALFPPDLFFYPNGRAYNENFAAPAAVILHLFGMIYMFYALALVCDIYFVPALDVIIEKLNLSPDVAGATFMAAGGSAPELFTSVIGVFIAVSDVGIGTIVGSAVFNVLFVIAVCAFASKKTLDLTAWPLLRDTVFYSIALIMLVGFFLDNRIEWWEALILFMWYGAYAGFMKFNECCEEKFGNTFPSLKKESVEIKAGFKFSTGRPLLELMKSVVNPVSTTNEIGEKKNVGMKGLLNQLKGGEEKQDALSVSTVAKVKQDGTNMPDQEYNETANEEYKDPILSGPKAGVVGTILYIYSFLLMFPLWLTLPDTQNPKKKKFFPITFIGSILWIAAFSYLMVWWATIFGRVVGISDAVMGLTLLAAGTSVPDLISSVIVARQGKGDMAVSSSIGSNIFDVTVGLPLPWLLWSISNGLAPMIVSSRGMGCSIGMLFLMLLIVIVSIIIFKWKMTKIMGGIMILMYIVFMAVSLLLSGGTIECPI